MDTTPNGHRCMTQAEYARYSDLDASYVSRLVRTGVIPLNADGRIDPAVADEARRQCIRLRVPSLTKARRLAMQTPHQTGDRIDEQVDAFVAAIEAQLRYSTNFVFVAKLNDDQLREAMCGVAKEFLKRWQKQGGAPACALTAGG